jgi:hypothetical protein
MTHVACSATARKRLQYSTLYTSTHTATAIMHTSQTCQAVWNSWLAYRNTALPQPQHQCTTQFCMDRLLYVGEPPSQVQHSVHLAGSKGRQRVLTTSPTPSITMNRRYEPISTTQALQEALPHNPLTHPSPLAALLRAQRSLQLLQPLLSADLRRIPQILLRSPQLIPVSSRHHINKESSQPGLSL